jgi:hypothetical protein
MEFEIPLVGADAFGAAGTQPAPSLRTQLKEARSFRSVSAASGKFANALEGDGCFMVCRVAMDRAAKPMRPHARKLREATGRIGLRPNDSVALGGDVGALASVRGSGAVNQSTADHMKNGEPEDKGGDQGLYAQSLPANGLSARWLGVNAAPLRYFLEYSGVIVQKMRVAANNLHRLASS